MKFTKYFAALGVLAEALAAMIFETARSCIFMMNTVKDSCSRKAILICTRVYSSFTFGNDL